MADISSNKLILFGLITATSLTGVATLAIAFLVMRKVDVYKTPYGVMMQAKCFHGILFLLYFLLFVAAGAWDIIPPVVAKWAGLPFLFFTIAVFITSSFLSAIRFVNVHLPFTGDKKYMTNAMYGNIFVFFISIGYVVPSIWEECRMYFNPEVFAFLFPCTVCSGYLAFYGDFIVPIVLFNVALFFDLCTVLKLRENRQKFSGNISSLQRRRRHRREISLTVQTLLNASLCFLMVISYHILPAIDSLPPFCILLVSSRYCWCFVIASGGYFSIIFDKEVRKFIRTKIFCLPATRRVAQWHPSASPIPISAENSPTQ